MKKATVTYTAPKGEAKTAEIHGTILVDGKAGEVICSETEMARLQNIPALKVASVSDYTPPPPKAEPPPKDDDNNKPKGKAA